jgi:hypothetical protein
VAVIAEGWVVELEPTDGVSAGVLEGLAAPLGRLASGVGSRGGCVVAGWGAPLQAQRMIANARSSVKRD